MSKDPKQRALQLFILITGSLVILAMTYYSGKKSTVKISRELDDRRKVAEQKYREAQRDVRVRLAVAYQLEARRRVAMALDELERRNFGHAQEHLGTAVQLLNSAAESGATVPDFGEVGQQLGTVNLTPGDNIETQRTTLVSLARQMDTALTAFVPEFLSAKTAEDKANPIQKPSLNDVPLPPGKEVGRKSKP